jgi:hypothetical protein
MAPGKRWMDFNYDAYGDHSKGWGAGFGFKDLEAAQQQGYSNPQIRILAQRAEKQGRTVGKLTWDKVNALQPPGSMPWDYGGVGGAEFGRADLDMALGQGADYNKIKEYTDYARKWGIGVGREASDWMRDEGQRIHNEDLLATQKAHQAETLRIQQEAAAEAARVQAEQFARANAVTTNAPTGVGGAASIRGSRLSITQAGGRSGTRQFARPSTQYLNTIGLGGSAASTGNQTITL